jgi:hypothetical protein
MPLRQFLYYDESLVNDFLAQLEGGQTGDVTKREQRQRGGKGELTVGAGPLKAGGGGGRSITEETEAVIRQSRASRFERLHELLVDADELVEIESLDPSTWNAIARGSLLEIDTQITIPQMARLFSDPSAFGNLASLVRAISPESIDAEAEKVIAGFAALAQVSGGEGGMLTAVGNPPGSPYRLVMRLDRKFMTTDAELDGEATVLVKMARRLKEDDREIIIDIPGMSTLGSDVRNSMSRTSGADEFMVQGPGAIVVPIAIFR